MWFWSSNHYTNKTFLIIFFSVKLILLIFIFYVIHHEEQLYSLWKYNNKTLLNQPLFIHSFKSQNKNNFNQSSTRSTVSSRMKHLNQSFNLSSEKLCDKKKLQTFLEIAQKSTLTQDEKQILLKTIASFTTELDKNHIDYITIGGSLLGIIRHGGLIPYDDDFDIGISEMDRSKVNKMIMKLNHSKLISVNKRDHTKVFMNRSNCIKEKKDNYCFPYLDIFFMKSNKTHSSLSGIYANVYANKDIYPRKRTKFNDIPVWIPNKWQAFFKEHDNVLKNCCTGRWIHKIEKSFKQRCIPCVCLFPNLTLSTN